MSRFWLLVGAFAASLSWLLPNHYPPWTAFHLEAWMACILMPMVIWLLCLPRPGIGLTFLPVVTATVALLIGLQVLLGVQMQTGVALLGILYVGGFFLAQMCGRCWVEKHAWQVGDGLFLAIGTAAVLSVGLQLQQWLQIEWGDWQELWLMGGGEGRPYANVGQPNQLATLQLGGLLSALWAVVRGVVRPALAILTACFLLFGVALTLSRTAWVGLFIIVACICLWHSLWAKKSTVLVSIGLALVFVLFLYVVRWLPEQLNVAQLVGWDGVVRATNESRPRIWSFFVNAVLQRPWFGYGWDQTGQAQMLTAIQQPALHQYYGSAHNLLIDLTLWFGIPVGLTLFASFAGWMAIRAKQLFSAEQCVCWMFLLVMGNHALLEFPLHYAYFLLPAGLLIGALDGTSKSKIYLHINRHLIIVIVLLMSTLFGLVIRDYFRIEKTHYQFRLRWAKLVATPVDVPQLTVLTQWSDFFETVQFDTSKIATDQQIQTMYAGTKAESNTGTFQVLALAHLRRGELEQAAKVLETMCRMSSELMCEGVKRFWLAQVPSDPARAKVPWP